MMLPYSMTYKVKFLFYFGCQLVGRDIGTFYFHARQYKRKLFIIDILNYFLLFLNPSVTIYIRTFYPLLLLFFFFISCMYSI